jgi:hypothetical protein
MSKDTGGPAYPVVTDYHDTDSGITQYETGVTWLDYAAIRIATFNARWFAETGIIPDSMATIAYDLATALLAEKRRREK